MKKLLSLVLAIAIIICAMPLGAFTILVNANTSGVYTITYYLDGGTNAPKNPDVYTEEDVITLMPATKSGYNFVGWFLDSGKTLQITEIYNMAENLELYAKFTPCEYQANFEDAVTLTLKAEGFDDQIFYLNYGEVIDPYSKEVMSIYVPDEQNETFSASDPNFSGWYYNSDYSNKVLGNVDLTANTTLYCHFNNTATKSAKSMFNGSDYAYYSGTYVDDTFRVPTFSNGELTIEIGIGCYYSEGNSQAYTQARYSIFNVTQNNYVASRSWSYQRYVDARYDTVSAIVNPGDVLRVETYSGVDSVSSNRYAWRYIEFSTERESAPINASIKTTSTMHYEDAISTPIPNIRVGYNFMGWYDASNNKISEIWNYLENQVFTTRWSPINYYITYNLDGATNSPSNPSSYTIEDEIIFGDPIKPGYTFKGWYLDSDYKTPITRIIKNTGNITLYAKFEVNSYNLSLDANGGVFAPRVTFVSDGVEINNIHLYDGDTLSAYRPTNRDGYIFAGWYSDSDLTTVFDFNGKIVNDVTLYAKWIECESNIINAETIESFDINIQGKAEKLYAFIPVSDGEIQVSSVSDNLDIFGTLYDASKNVLISSDDISYSDLDFSYSYSVKAGQLYYIGIKGSTASTEGITTINVDWIGDYTITGVTYPNRKISMVYDTEYNLPKKPIKNDYVFLGWFDENGTKIEDGIWNFTTDKSLTAKWEPGTPSEKDYTVVFKNWDGTVISNTSYVFGDEVIIPDNPTRSEDSVHTYVFVGWDKEVVNSNENTIYTVTYTAVYKSIRKDGLRYIIEDEQVIVNQYLGGNNVVVIPEEIDGLPVTGIDASTFKDNVKLNSIIIPSSITSIGYNAFSGCTNLTTVFYGGTLADKANVTIGTNNLCLNEANWHYEVNDETFNNEVVYFCGECNLLYFANGKKVPLNQLELVTKPIKSSYGVGEDINLSGLALRGIYDGGKTVLLGHEVIDNVNADLSTEGKKSVVITVAGATIEFEIVVHRKSSAIVTVLANLYPESKHNYGNYLYEEKTFTYPGAEYLVITFDNRTYVEYKYDYIFIIDGNGTVIESYTGSSAANETLTITGDTFTIRLTSDGRGQYYGYAFSSIQASMPNMGGFIHVPVTDPSTATCTQDGLSEGSHCEICDIVLVAQQPIPALGHEYSNECDTVCNVCGLGREITHIYTNDCDKDCNICGDLREIVHEYNQDNICKICNYNKIFDYIKYRIQNNEAVIYSCNESIYGNFIIPSIIDGYLVTSIGDWAFSGCTSLTSITIPDSVTSIGSYAFEDCTDLTSITIPNSVTSIGYYAFYNCDGLTGVYITDIAAWCKIEFYNYSSNPLCYAKNLYLNNELVTELIIPDGVTSIGSYAFYYCTSLASITIPDSVTSIGEGAFEDCTGLTSITIPDSVTSIGSYAFYGCYGLASATIGDSVTSIGSYAFEDCTGLTSITIPNSVTSIGSYAFYNCTRLTGVYITDIAAWCKIEFDNHSSNPLYCAKNLYLNNELVTELIIPDGITSIGDYAFYYCTSLTSITIPDCVTSIGEGAFSGCDYLTIYYEGSEDDALNIVIFSDTFTDAYVTWYYNSCIGSADHTYSHNCDYECNVCGATRKPSAHRYDNTCDTTCNECGAVREITHTYSNNCDTDCNVCGLTRTPSAHIYDNACDTTCNECGGVREITHTYSNNCDASCNICGSTRTIPDHVYGDKYDADCNECGAVREVPNQVWHISVTQTGFYMIGVNDIYNKSYEYINVYDSENNIVKYNEALNGWLLIKGEHYLIIVTANYTIDLDIVLIETKTFPDVSKSGWYYDAVTYVVGAGIMSGYSNGKFGTSDSIQRQDFLVMLARYEGVNLDEYNYKSKFSDVARGSYYEAAVNWGAEMGIVTGYNNGKFGVGDKVTREQLVTFLYRYAKYKGINTTCTTAEKNYVKNTYSDYKNVSAFAQEAIIWAVTYGVIGGKTPTTIVPQGNAQRCEVAKIMYNIYLNDIF